MLKHWIIASRPQTFIISVSPVVVGTILSPVFHFWTFLLTLLTALGIQITSHFASDYFDHLTGSDSNSGKSFTKVISRGFLSLQAMKRATILSLTFTALFGMYPVWIGGTSIAWTLSVALAMAVCYSGGPYPLGYLGISDLFAFAFYGPVAVIGTYYLQTGHYSSAALIAGVSPGGLAATILMINNLRDVEEDRQVGKKTLVVRFGTKFGKVLYLLTLLAALLAPLFLGKLWPLLNLIPAFFLARSVFSNTNPYGYNALFKKSGLLLAAHTLLFCL
jgi:1,4-dihydroxy-2-naphthoate octaprenyltransferase